MPTWTWVGLPVLGAAEVVIAFAGSPPADAVAHSVTMGGVLLLSTLLLVRAADHRQRLTEQLADLAALDPLTGLFTRRELERAAASALGTHAPRRREPGPRPAVGLLILDLDRFKELNDSHGHLVGDAALVHLARVVRAAAPRPAVVARLGGDELAVLAPDCDQTDPETIASEVLRALGDQPVREGGLVLGLSASIGVARVLPREGRALAELYAAADAALYRAKLGGRGRVVVG